MALLIVSLMQQFQAQVLQCNGTPWWNTSSLQVACWYWLPKKSNAVICSCPTNNKSSSCFNGEFSFPSINWQIKTVEVSSATGKVKATSRWQRQYFENTGVAVLSHKSDFTKALFKSLTWQNKYNISLHSAHSHQHYEIYHHFWSGIIHTLPILASISFPRENQHPSWSSAWQGNSQLKHVLQ